MIIKKIKDQLLEARKSKNELVKNLLSVALGDIQLQGSRPGQNGEVTDQQAEKIVHKLMKSNEETMRVASPELARKLQLENEILSALLPKACTKEEMKVCL